MAETLTTPGIFIEKIGCHQPGRTSLVLIHGWGVDARVFAPLSSMLDKTYNLSLLHLPGYGKAIGQAWPMQMGVWLRELAPQLPDCAFYLGWSMGGQVALALARLFPSRVCGLLLLASNPCFVARSDWHGMEPEVFSAFLAGLRLDALATLKRFRGLVARGGGAGVLRQLHDNQQGLPASGLVLEASLLWLQQQDSRADLCAVSCPVLGLFGNEDALVSSAVVDSLARGGKVRVGRLPGAGHALPLTHLTEIEQTLSTLAALPQQLSSGHRQFDKREVAMSFSRAARSYDGAAEFQRQVCDALGRRGLDAPSMGPAPLLLDLGCGTGYGLRRLAQVPGAQVVALDLAEGMLRQARHQTPPPTAAIIQWLVGDGENLPLADATVDLVFSSLVIQWCENLSRLMRELYRVLKPGGRVLVSTLGPGTLGELKQAWAAVDAYEHVNRFAAVDQLAVAATEAGFVTAWEVEAWIRQFVDVREVTRELKSIGAHNVTRGRPRGLTGRLRLRGMVAAYEAQRLENGALPATYEVIFGLLQKPEESES